MAQLVSCANDLKFFHVPSYQVLHSYDPFKHGNKIKKISLSIATANSQYIVCVSSQKGIAEVASVNQNGISKMGNVRNLDNPSTASFGNTTHRYLAMGSSKGTVAIYDLKTKNFHKYFETLKSSISHLQYNSNDSYLAAGCENGEIVVFSTVKNIKSSTLTVGKNSSVSALRFHSVTKQFLAAGDHNGSVAVWDINIQKPKLSLGSVHNSKCSDIAFSPLNSQLVVTVSYDKHINCYDLTSNSKVFSQKLDQVLSSLDFHPDGNSVAVGTYAGNIYTIDFRNNFKIVDTIEAHEGEIHTLMYRSSKNDLKSSKNASMSSVYQSFMSAASCNSSPIGNDSFINMTGSTQQEDTASDTNGLSDVSTNSSILDVMGLSEPVYEDEVGLSPIPVRGKAEIDSNSGNCIQRTENSKELSFNLSVQIDNRESQVVQLVENNLQENNNYPESITPIVHTDNSEVLLAVNRLKTSVNANIDDVLNIVQNTNYRIIELAERLRVQDIYLKMEMFKQFIKQEDRLDAIHHNLLNEIYKLREENANLRNELTLNKHNNC